MASERLDDLILISSEKTMVDTLNIPVIVDTFAAVPCDLLCTALVNNLNLEFMTNYIITFNCARVLYNYTHFL